MKPTVYTVIIIAVILALMWIEAARRNASHAAPPLPRIAITQEMYDKIHPGMTVEDVVQIMGAEPGHKEFNPSPRGTLFRFKWIDHDRHAVYVNGIDNKVTEKGNTWPTSLPESMQ